MSERAASTSSTTAACLLRMNDRVLVHASGPPVAEYAMFDLGEIELCASEPGRVHEHGYRTTADLARSRLANVGITAEAAREVASAMQPVLTDAYARGDAVRRVARYLGPTELLQSDTYDAATKSYLGGFFALATLAQDLGLEHAGATLHALYLATVLEGEAGATTILLSTTASLEAQRPGARTHRRPSFVRTQQLVSALGALAQRSPRPEIHGPLARQDVIAHLRERADAAADDDARALYRSLESAVALRDMPERGPLATPELWEIEQRIDYGNLDGTLDAIDQLERRSGRSPGTTYLRARVSLMMQLEPAKRIAERVSALALSMTSFQELALLAAEAWLEADDPRRALPYARDLVDAPGIEEGLLLRAQRVLARAVGDAPSSARRTLVDSLPAAPKASRPPPSPGGARRMPAVDGPALEATFERATPDPPMSEGPDVDLPRPERGTPALALPSFEGSPTGAPPMMAAASFTLDLPRPEPTPRTPPPPPLSSETGRPSPRRTSSSGGELRPLRFLQGASLPPFRHESHAPALPNSPPLPKLEGDDDLAEHLALPSGNSGDEAMAAPSLEALPGSVDEARAQFTQLARELGRSFRLTRGIVLRTDVTGIEAMQSALLEAFPDRVVRTEAEAAELRRHGALLSEILARRLGAVWIDISPNELGYWVMIVPPDTRIWPFGRVARFVAMGHKERDLVSYFLELEARTSANRAR